MKFQFKQQQFQTAAAEAICDVFDGQPKQSDVLELVPDDKVLIGANAPLQLNAEQILANLRGVQKNFSLPISERLDGMNFTVEMETGVGKTYTYIKTMYELNRRYGWSKFIVVVPSVAIREGVKKTFAVTEEHFKAQYDKAIRHFVYNSANLSMIRTFTEDAAIWAMIVNVQAFSSRSADARRMLQNLDEFSGRVPLETIAHLRPIIIIDEPQSVEGTVARQRLKDFKPLMTLRYSATHRDLYNQVYKLDARKAYRDRLVKKIKVMGIEIVDDQARGYIFFERVNLSSKDPTATVAFKRRDAGGLKRITRTLKAGDDLFKLSNSIDDYRGCVVTEIDGAENSLTFGNGLKLYTGQATGDINEDDVRRIQIRETIQAHLKREAELYERGIKVLSLFFIDEVAKYRRYDDDAPTAGLYAKIFEEEYAAAVEHFDTNAAHRKYLDGIAARDTHAGYFSVDKKNRFVDSRRRDSDDADAYDLIMRNKERLLDLREPVRFIFSHSALREGWDNPNVFQICALKQSTSDVRRRQEVGRGMRLCVNQIGERMDAEKLGEDNFLKVNVLTVVASESYRVFADGLQREIAEACPQLKPVEPNLFVGKKIDNRLARKIYNELIRRDYLDDDGRLTEKYFADAQAGTLNFGDELESARADIIRILETVGGGSIAIDNGREEINVQLNAANLNSADFQELWQRIRRRGFYRVADDNDFVTAAADALNEKLHLPESKAVFANGILNDELEFVDGDSTRRDVHGSKATDIDLIGELVKATGLTRHDTVEILHRLAPDKFALFNRNAERFVRDAAQIINETKTARLVEGINYAPTEEYFDTNIFDALTVNGRRNLLATKKNVYDRLLADSGGEKDFAKALEAATEVIVYAKLPKSFYLPTPAGRYSPDWAIVLRVAGVTHYLIVETKASDDENQLRGVERIKIACARKYFGATANGSVQYALVKSYRQLTDILRGE